MFQAFLNPGFFFNQTVSSHQNAAEVLNLDDIQPTRTEKWNFNLITLTGSADQEELLKCRITEWSLGGFAAFWFKFPTVSPFRSSMAPSLLPLGQGHPPPTPLIVSASHMQHVLVPYHDPPINHNHNQTKSLKIWFFIYLCYLSLIPEASPKPFKQPPHTRKKPFLNHPRRSDSQRQLLETWQTLDPSKKEKLKWRGSVQRKEEMVVAKRED